MYGDYPIGPSNNSPSYNVPSYPTPYQGIYQHGNTQPSLQPYDQYTRPDDCQHVYHTGDAYEPVIDTDAISFVGEARYACSDLPTGLGPEES